MPAAGFLWLLAASLAFASAAAVRQKLPGSHVPAALARLTPVGPLPGAQRLNLAIGLPLRNQPELDALLQGLYDTASPLYHQYLTPEQFTERFGPTEQDYQALIDFAQASGLTVTVTHPNRVVLDVAASAADIARVFQVNLRVYQHPKEGRTFYAPDTEPTVACAVPILHISGLDDYSLPHPNFVLKPASASANATPNAGSGPGGTYRGSDFRSAYVPGTALTGTGQSVGLLQFDGFSANDIATYASQAGLPSVPLTVVPIDGGVSTPGSGNGEVCLDIEMAMAMAPGLSRIYVYEAPNPSPWVDLLSRMANDNLSKQLSCSWGGGGPDAAAEQIFMQMASQGQSFFNATGDSDAFTGAISFPSDSTNITEVGGTTLTTGTAAAYASETTWNWGLQSGSYVGSSGGVSTTYKIPSYQQGLSMAANLGSTTMRNVPDVALTGDNVYVVYNNGSAGTFGGTSCAAPLWAGFTALVNQQALAAGRGTVGFLNPALYNLGKSGGYAAAFHDTTTGNNFNANSPAKFPAVTGYDLCTGWGTPNGTNLINVLAGPPIIVPFLVANGFTLLAEGCPNGVVDPGETVSVSLAMKNTGAANTTNLVATLLASGGIVAPSGPQAYGVVSTNGATVARSFSFTASGSCGATNTATLQLQDGAVNLGSLTFSFRLGLANVASVFAQSFDGVTAPALPAGWTTSASGSESAWATATTAKDTAPNALFSPDPATVGLNELDTPSIALPAGAAQLTFRHSYDLESGYDGGVLEIAIAGGAWTDIQTAGGSFAGGGYGVVLSSSYGNPLAGRSAWTGNSGGFITTTVNLPTAASGQSIQLRWRCGTDTSVSKTGWYLDTVSITSSSYVCCTANADLGVAVTASPDPVAAGQNLTYLLTVTNLGASAAASVTITDALPPSVTFVSASPGCIHLGGNVVCALGTLSSGSTSNLLVVVAPTVGGPITNTVTLASPTTDPNPLNNRASVATTVNAPPAITAQPVSQSAIVGSNVTFQVAANGSTPLSFQWRHSGTNLAGASNASLTLLNVQAEQAGAYTVQVTNAYGSVLSSNAALTVLDPWIVSQPKNQLVVAGGPATFDVTAVGTLPISYQWFKQGVALVDGTNISGARTASLTVAQAQEDDTGTYSVTVSNLHGQAASSSAVLTGPFPPVIASQPLNQTVLAGATVSFTVVAAGGSPLGFQWQRGGTNLADGGKFSGAATASLVVSNVQAGEMGSYSVIVTNAYGPADSANAVLSVWPLLSWGRNDYLQADIPGGLSNVTAVAGGGYHSLALRADGTVVAWGAGTINSGTSPQYGQAVVPGGLTTAAGVAAGYYHSLAVRSNGTVVAWGAGTTSTGASPEYGQSLVPAGLTNVSAADAGAYFSVALRTDGTVAAWGNNSYGQTNVPAGLSNVVAIAAGGFHGLALQADGTVVGWGAGATNTGLAPNNGQSAVPKDLTNVVAIAAGAYHSLALKADGTAVAWGFNNAGQTNVPAGLSNVVALAGGFFYSLALTADGTMVGWGNNAYGQAKAPAGAAHVARIAAGNFHSLALQSDGRPIFTVQPVSQSVSGGSTVRLQPMVAGVQPLSYQWQRSGTNLPGATSSALTLANLQYTDAGPYTLLAANALGTATSAPAVVTLQPWPGPILSLRAPPGAPPSISFPSQPGSNYLLEYKNRLFDPSWTPLFPPVTATGSVMVLQDTNPPGASRYYRLRSE